ncbi:MAG: WD40 repeat domain-containing protein [Ktedonobacteraceae bacterium]
MQEDRDVFSRFLSRRHVVKGIAGLTLAAGLAACGASPAQTTGATSATAPAKAATPTAIPKQATSSGPIATLFTFRGHTDAVNQVAWAFDNTLIASVSDDGTAQIWNAFTGAVKLIYKEMHGPVKSVSWSSDGKRIVVAGNTVQVVDATSGKLILTFNQPNSRKFSASWSPDGKYIAVIGEDSMAYVWDAATGKVINAHMVGGAGSAGTAIAWPITNTTLRIAAEANDGTVQAWDALTGQNVVIYKVSGTVNALAWVGDAGATDAERLLVFGCSDGSTQVWNASSATKQNSFPGAGAVLAASPSFSKDVFIASGTNDSTVPVWQLYSGTKICTYTGHTDSVTTVAWSFTAGQQIASGGKDKTVQVWQPPLD